VLLDQLFVVGSAQKTKTSHPGHHKLVRGFYHLHAGYGVSILSVASK